MSGVGTKGVDAGFVTRHRADIFHHAPYQGGLVEADKMLKNLDQCVLGGMAAPEFRDPFENAWPIVAGIQGAASGV